MFPLRNLARKGLKIDENIKYLTHLPLDKMAAISQIADSSAFSWQKRCILIRISLTFVPNGPIDNRLALTQVLAWRRTGDKPLSEPILTQFNDAYMRIVREDEF